MALRRDQENYEQFIEGITSAHTTPEELLRCLRQVRNDEDRYAAVITEIVRRPLERLDQTTDKVRDASERLIKSSDRVERLTRMLVGWTIVLAALTVILAVKGTADFFGSGKTTEQNHAETQVTGPDGTRNSVAPR